MVGEKGSRDAFALGVAALFLVCCTTSPRTISLLGGSDSGGGGNRNSADSGHTEPRESGIVAPSTGGADASTYDAPDTGFECASDRDCAKATPHCERATGECVECTSDGNCASGLCDETSHTCSGCSGDDNCRGQTPHCQVAEQRCVQCLNSTQCALGEACSDDVHACIARCRSAADCVGSSRLKCAVAAGVCVECTSDGDCLSPGAPRCDLFTGSCVACLSDSDCSSFLHCQLVEHTCRRECHSNADCPPGKSCVGDDCEP